MTLLTKASPTISQEIEGKLSCNLPRKSGIATFSTVSAPRRSGGALFRLLTPEMVIISRKNGDSLGIIRLYKRKRSPAPQGGTEYHKGGTTMSVIHIDRNNFQREVLNSDRPVLLDFWAPWCAPCRMVGPILDLSLIHI